MRRFQPICFPDEEDFILSPPILESRTSSPSAPLPSDTPWARSPNAVWTSPVYRVEEWTLLPAAPPPFGRASPEWKITRWTSSCPPYDPSYNLQPEVQAEPPIPDARASNASEHDGAPSVLTQRGFVTGSLKPEESSAGTMDWSIDIPLEADIQQPIPECDFRFLLTTIDLFGKVLDRHTPADQQLVPKAALYQSFEHRSELMSHLEKQCSIYSELHMLSARILARISLFKSEVNHGVDLSNLRKMFEAAENYLGAVDRCTLSPDAAVCYGQKLLSEQRCIDQTEALTMYLNQWSAIVMLLRALMQRINEVTSKHSLPLPDLTCEHPHCISMRTKAEISEGPEYLWYPDFIVTNFRDAFAPLRAGREGRVEDKNT